LLQATVAVRADFSRDSARDSFDSLHSIDGFRASDTREGSTRSRQNSVPVADPKGRGRRDEGQHGGDQDPGQLPWISRAQAAEGVHATPPSFSIRATAATAATTATEPAGSATEPGKEPAKAEGISLEEAEHSGGARGEVSDEDTGGHSRLPGAEEAAGCAGRGDEDPGWFPWLQDAKIAKAKRPVDARSRFLSRCQGGDDAGYRSAQEVLMSRDLALT